MARAFAWAQVTTGIAIGMVLPMLLGLALDRWLGTVVLFTVIGAALGMAWGIWRLLRIGRNLPS